jgi:hypothetical protein
VRGCNGGDAIAEDFAGALHVRHVRFPDPIACDGNRWVSSYVIDKLKSVTLGLLSGKHSK